MNSGLLLAAAIALPLLWVAWMAWMATRAERSAGRPMSRVSWAELFALQSLVPVILVAALLRPFSYTVLTLVWLFSLKAAAVLLLTRQNQRSASGIRLAPNVWKWLAALAAAGASLGPVAVISGESWAAWIPAALLVLAAVMFLGASRYCALDNASPTTPSR